MHGRLKVKSTAEQKEAKEKERQKKLKIYTAANLKISEKRKNKEHDKEALSLTGEILSVNPDAYSLWNFRREIFAHFKETKSEEEVQSILKEELQFLEGCLHINPKSYGTWHHRSWVMEFIPQPDWSLELTLCNKYLEYDERNFHCWDYRRYVVKHSNVLPKDELKFTTSKISSNFSNYSSWYYRSKLLPLIYPDENSPVGVQEDILLSEFELVQNAFFTDPNDQSAWFYHRWLLGRDQKNVNILCLYICRKTKKLSVTLSKPVKVGKEVNLQLFVNNNPVICEWQPATANQLYSQFWTCNLSITDSDHYEVTVTLDEGIQDGCKRKCSLAAEQMESWEIENPISGSIFRSEMSAAKSAILEQELESCQQLHDLEPDNKWTLLTIVSLMKALDPISFEQQMVDYIDKLIEVDNYRQNYYKDLRSKFLIENQFEKTDGFPEELDLSGRDLTCFCHADRMCLLRSLNMSSNQFTKLPELMFMPRLEELKVQDNHLDSLKWMHSLENLKELSISNNNLTSLEELQPLEVCKSLEILSFDNNPVCNTEDFTSRLVSLVPSLRILNSKSIKT